MSFAYFKSKCRYETLPLLTCCSVIFSIQLMASEWAHPSANQLSPMKTSCLTKLRYVYLASTFSTIFLKLIILHNKLTYPSASASASLNAHFFIKTKEFLLVMEAAFFSRSHNGAYYITQLKQMFPMSYVDSELHVCCNTTPLPAREAVLKQGVCGCPYQVCIHVNLVQFTRPPFLSGVTFYSFVNCHYSSHLKRLCLNSEKLPAKIFLLPKAGHFSCLCLWD